MTKEQVKAAVAAKIAGQGNQVDQGGALADVLDAIVDLIPAEPEPPTPEEIMNLLTLASQSQWVTDGASLTREQAAANLGITTDDFAALLAGKYLRITFLSGKITYVSSICESGIILGEYDRNDDETGAYIQIKIWEEDNIDIKSKTY